LNPATADGARKRSLRPTPGRRTCGSDIKPEWEFSTPNIGERFQTPSNHEVGKGERYYRQIAVNRADEAILKGKSD
jgi:hypothetical protein